MRYTVFTPIRSPNFTSRFCTEWKRNPCTHHTECDPPLEEVLETCDDGEGYDDGPGHDEQDVDEEENGDPKQSVRMPHVHIHIHARPHHCRPTHLVNEEQKNNLSRGRMQLTSLKVKEKYIGCPKSRTTFF
ncbi:hypothetical protein TNIN_208121 [Trichonephila inaurata madagascariensis]|uniref:Uncharacterized protein n=1 Tax=Trichonephila inaurata madagascariensis TaxID=2747483 RepID=A0A8X7BYR3_9ARAC|nr:hypothetical protein TNIN_208121 [Trichonephila inaurata madagascariensis]